MDAKCKRRLGGGGAAGRPLPDDSAKRSNSRTSIPDPQPNPYELAAAWLVRHRRVSPRLAALLVGLAGLGGAVR
jgi:hypothetical protein